MIATFKTLNLPLRLLGLILVALFFFVLTKIIITLTNPESLWTQSVTTAPVVTRTASSIQSFSFSTDPFNGETQAVEVEEEVVIGADVPETTLNLKTTGHIAGEKGSANIRTPDNKEAAYRIGDEVISDVFLKALHKDFIVLEVNGQLQRLTVDREKLDGFTQKKTPEPEITKRAVNRGAGQTNSKTSKQGFAGDVLKLLETVKFKKSVKNGQVQGYTVASNKPGFDLKLFGFQQGDIVTQINGNDLTANGVDFLSLAQDTAHKGDMNITVLRNGQSQNIKLGAN